MENQEILTKCAKESRLLQLFYQKYGDPEPIGRVVEPYALQEGGGHLMLLCWQLFPEIAERVCWRNFRFDRMSRLLARDEQFSPRCPITLHLGEVRQFRMDYVPVQSLGAAHQYSEFLDAIFRQSRVSVEQYNQASALAQQIGEEELRGIHGGIFRDVLHEVLQDSIITETEADYLSRTRRLLKRLGWAP